MSAADTDLCKRLGYQFNDMAHLELALTHRSYGSFNNERLEFLGDSILGMIIAKELYFRFPQSSEGQLSKMRAFLVKGRTLSQVARDLNIGQCLRLGVGELKSGGVDRDSILEDTCEAIIGAIYLDSDLDTCRSVILKWFSDRIESLSETDLSPQDAKSRLQEALQGKGHDLPIYEVVKTEGKEHAQTFYVKCSVPVFEIEAEGYGKSRKAAEQNAAESVLKLILEA